MGDTSSGGGSGTKWSDLLALYFQYKAASEAGKPGKITDTITPQMKELFDRMMGLIDYSPTRDYISSYADSFIKSSNAPGGATNWKPTFQSDYMKGQQPLPNMSLDLSKLPIMQGDATGKMPWNYGFSGPGIGGKPTKWPATGPGAGAGGGGGGGRGLGFGPNHPRFFDSVPPSAGDWSSDYHNNPYNPDFGDPFAPDDFYGTGGGEPRDQFGMLVDSMNNTNFRDIVKPNPDGTVSLHFPGMPQPSTLSADEWARLQAKEAAFKKFVSERAADIWKYAQEHKVDFLKAALLLAGI